jgi:hypothetical protein
MVNREIIPARSEFGLAGEQWLIKPKPRRLQRLCGEQTA